MACASNSVNNEQSKSYTSKNRILLLIALMFSNYWMGASYVLFIPFLPDEIKKRNGPSFMYEILLALYQIIIIFLSPFVGKVKLSPNVLSYGAIFLCGSAALLMALLRFLSSSTAFLILAFIARTCDSIGSTFYSASIYSLLVMIFPENKAIIISSMESLNGLGIITGPAFSQLLYYVGGFSLPYMVLSFFFMLSAFAAKILLPNAGNVPLANTTSLNKIVFHSSFIMDLLVCFSAYFAIGYNTDTLKVHLSQFHLDRHVLAAILISLGGIYIVFVPVWGRLCDTLENLKPLTGLAMLSTLVGFILIGPLPFIPIEPVLWLSIVSEIFLGIGMGGQLICGFFDGIRGTIRRGFPDSISTYTNIFGSILSATALGSLVGPFFGYILTQYKGYVLATAYATGVEFVVTVIVWIYIIYRRIRFTNEEETRHLLAN